MPDQSPSFCKKLSAGWIDFVLLVGAYLVLGFISEHIFLEDAYPPATGMQLYSQRDFVVYWFFVRWSMILTFLYLLVSYKIFGGTVGQKLLKLKLLDRSMGALTNKNIFLRILVVLTTLILLMVPGPVVALMFVILGAEFLNTSFSVVLLLSVIFSLFYFSFTRYSRGKTRSLKDMLSQTVLVDMNKLGGKRNSA